VEVVADTALAAAVARARAVVVGADQVLADGSVVNRSSTFSLALAARHHGVPFYVLSQRTKFTGEQEADLSESAPLGPELPPGVPGFSPMFDLTPALLVHRLICEEGVLEPAQAASAGREHAALLAALLAG
jgi:translation initiation factor 2B subunit (eIF-2B alpha/beta/delta family)